MSHTSKDQQRQALIEFMREIPRPVSQIELQRRLIETRSSVPGNQDRVYGTMASQNNALGIELSRDLAHLTEVGALNKLEDGTFTVELRAPMPS
jgi:hypothetical protein